MNTTRGGARKGAGRPNGRDHKSINISLPNYMINYLHSQVCAGNRSKFIADAIDQAITNDTTVEDRLSWRLKYQTTWDDPTWRDGE
jgi:hypothetical protein